MHLSALINDLAVILLTAGVVTILFKKMNQPLVLGYIVAGFLIGPYMPLFFTVADSAAISTWSEIGIIILMFGLGLEFNLHKLASVGGTAVITAITEVGGMLLLGYFAGQIMGWGNMDSIFLGGMLSMSSTTIIIKAFDELKIRQKPFAGVVFGTLIVEDIAGIFMMIILSTISVSQNISGGALTMKLGLLVLYLALWLIAGIYLLPTLLRKASNWMNDETLLIVSLGICFGMVLLADALGFSSALGAFLAGSLLAGTIHGERVEHLTKGVKDLFGSVFFISVGMMLDPQMVVRYIGPIAVITLVTILGKLFFSSLGALLSGQPLFYAVHCGCSLAQIGEFAFIIASLGISLGVLADYVYPIIITVSVITTLTTPFFIKGAEKVYAGIDRMLSRELSERLERLTDADQSQKEKNSLWKDYLTRYLKRTILFGTLMMGAVLTGKYLVEPILIRFFDNTWIQKGITIVFIYAIIALFIGPMMDTRAPEYTALWIQKKSFHLPLMALTVIRLILIVVLLFLPLEMIFGLRSLWLLPLLAAAMWGASRSGWLASAYLALELKFLRNFNEREINETQVNPGELLDLRMHIADIEAMPDIIGRNLKQLSWGRQYGVNVVRIRRQHEMIPIPSPDEWIAKGDILTIIGERDPICNLCNRYGIPIPNNLSLKEYVGKEKGQPGDLYTYAMLVKEQDAFSNVTIRDSGLKEHYDCMVLGLQRNGLPIVSPDPNLILEAGDIVWLLGSVSMTMKLIELPLE